MNEMNTIVNERNTIVDGRNTILNRRNTILNRRNIVVFIPKTELMCCCQSVYSFVSLTLMYNLHTFRVKFAIQNSWRLMFRFSHYGPLATKVNFLSLVQL